MSWNYRFVRRQSPNPDGTMEEIFDVREVYYNADGSIQAWSSEPAHASGETKLELADDLSMMFAAIQKPVLEYGDLPGAKP